MQDYFSTIVISRVPRFSVKRECHIQSQPAYGKHTVAKVGTIYRSEYKEHIYVTATVSYFPRSIIYWQQGISVAYYRELSRTPTRRFYTKFSCIAFGGKVHTCSNMRRVRIHFARTVVSLAQQEHTSQSVVRAIHLLQCDKWTSRHDGGLKFADGFR